MPVGSTQILDVLGIDYVEEITGRSAAIDANDEHRYVRTFQIFTNDQKVNALTLRQIPVPYLPAIREIFNNNFIQDSAAVVVRKTFTQNNIDTPTIWTCVVDYEWDVIQRPPEVEWGTNPYRRFVVKDQTGAPIVNSAGDPISGIEIEEFNQTVTIQKAVSIDFWNALDLLKYRGKINNDAFTIHGKSFSPYQAKMIGIGATYKYEAGYAYYIVRYELEIRERSIAEPSPGDEEADTSNDTFGWYPTKILDAGYRQINDTTGKLSTILDEQGGLPFSTPTPLDGEGKKLAFGQPLVFLEFDLYKAVDFAPLNMAP